MKLDEKKWYAHQFEDEFQKNNRLQIYLPKGLKIHSKKPVEQNQSFAEKHPIIANILQAELVVAGLIVSWFLVTFFYHVGYFMKWDIPMQFMEIDLIAGTKIQVVVTYIMILVFVIVLLNLDHSHPIIKNSVYILSLITGAVYLIYLFYIEWKYGAKYSLMQALQNLPFLMGWYYFSIILLFGIDIRKGKFGVSIILMLIMALTLLPILVAWFPEFSFPIIYKNGKITNQVIVSTYRDYFLVGYYKGNTIYPCYRLVKMVDDDKLNETEVAPKSQKKVFKYSNDQYQISTSNIQFKPPDHFNKKSCPNF